MVSKFENQVNMHKQLVTFEDAMAFIEEHSKVLFGKQDFVPKDEITQEFMRSLYYINKVASGNWSDVTPIHLKTLWKKD